jgi:hypothetical protein
MALSTPWVGAAPVVTPAALFGLPEDCAVPALLVPGEGDVVPALPPADELLEPVPWATVNAGASRIAIVASAAVADSLRMEVLPCADQRARETAVPADIGAMQFAQADRI